MGGSLGDFPERSVVVELRRDEPKKAHSESLNKGSVQKEWQVKEQKREEGKMSCRRDESLMMKEVENWVVLAATAGSRVGGALQEVRQRGTKAKVCFGSASGGARRCPPVFVASWFQWHHNP